jgi:pimeloyl-ACP methyl ester carboxylesterase
MIHPGNGDANSYSNIVNKLAENYTVVTYDRRGYSRSKLEDPSEMQSLEIQSNDAFCLLSTLTSEPAYVFGSSAGALIGFIWLHTTLNWFLH